MKRVKEFIKKVNKWVVKVQVTFLLTIIYFLVVTPLGYLKRLLINNKHGQKTYWQKVDNSSLTIIDFYKQY